MPLPPIPSFNPFGDGGNEPTAAQRQAREVVGGYFANRPGDVRRQTSGSLAGGGAYIGQDFDPYRRGDQHRILSRLVNQDAIYDLQLALIQAGLIDDGDIALGYLDDATEEGFAHVLALANQNGMEWRDVLSQVTAAGGVGGNDSYGAGGSEAELAPTVIQLPNRDDVAAALGDVGMERTGERLDDDLLDAATESVLDQLRTQQERQVQRELGATGEGVTFTESAPDPGRLLEEEIEERVPEQVIGKQTRDLMDEWMSAVKGPI
jgi:hypothetical protein